jgi:hypothetical protein
VGDILRCFFAGAGDSSGAAVGETFGRRFGDAGALDEGVSDAVARGEAFAFDLGEGVGDDALFFAAVDLCLRGVGVGVGANIFLSVSPSDS